MLVRSKLRPTTTHAPGTTPCNQDHFKTCHFNCTSRSKDLNARWMLQAMCMTRHIASYIQFVVLNAPNYISETGRTLDTHLKDHLKDIKYHRNKPNHFHQAGHSIHNVRAKGMWKTNKQTNKNQTNKQTILFIFQQLNCCIVFIQPYF